MSGEISALGRWSSGRAGGAGGATTVAPRPLYPVSRIHLAAMTDHVGIWQHAQGSEPDPKYGYCTDDVARLLVVDVMHSRQLPAGALAIDITRSLRFLEAAFDRAAGRFRNFRGADGEWLDHGGSEDSHARALAGLADVMAAMPDTIEAEVARGLFRPALPAAGSFRGIRPIARSILACDGACEAGLAARVLPMLRVLADRLADAFAETDAQTSWPWPESVLTYENALVPQALIVAGLRLGRVSMVERGCAVLDWLVEVQSGEAGVFSPVGNQGWWPRNGIRSQFDQQPIDAATTVSAASAAFAATGLRRYLSAAEQAYGWFLGDNDVGVEIADPVNGACGDGLGPVGVNPNQGAESTLMWLTALEKIRDLRGDQDGTPR
jgi:hypothetical protein